MDERFGSMLTALRLSYGKHSTMEVLHHLSSDVCMYKGYRLQQVATGKRRTG